MVTAKRFVIAGKFDGLLKVIVIFRSVFGRFLKEGDTMVGEAVGRVIESRSTRYPVGATVVAGYGWRAHGGVHEDEKHSLPTAQLRTVPEDFPKDLSTGLMLGVTVMPGMTAYFGLLDVCQAKAGEIVLVNAAAGAVGSLVGQIGKIKGCKVIGCAGTDEKVNWLRELGFDYVFNYKTGSLDEELKTAAPEGIDCYFDNGKVKYKEHVTSGFDQTPQALIGVLTGGNTGKAIVKV
ncbi:PTGR1 [Branchiostoma lanceolatum]|uniref:15-oxoprostaglandin 13-reductase n=1 Tax=Branchiostoma lanceolatum TaxID=7740 RepID=A0A8J9Z959_BRALA|nr:PTGR1 [Branchiostoma lanceolatum]